MDRQAENRGNYNPKYKWNILSPLRQKERKTIISTHKDHSLRARVLVVTLCVLAVTLCALACSLSLSARSRSLSARSRSLSARSLSPSVPSARSTFLSFGTMGAGIE